MVNEHNIHSIFETLNGEWEGRNGCLSSFVGGKCRVEEEYWRASLRVTMIIHLLFQLLYVRSVGCTGVKQVVRGRPFVARNQRSQSGSHCSGLGAATASAVLCLRQSIAVGNG